MNSLTKKLAAGVIAAATMLGIAGLGATTANADAAASDGVIKISSSSAEFNGKTVTAYQMFSYDKAAVGNGTATNAGYKLIDSWDAFFKAKATDFSLGTVTDDNVKQKAYDYVSGLKDKALVEFAKTASDWAKVSTNDAALQAAGLKHTADATQNGKQYTATIDGLAYGYYVVSPQSGSTDTTDKRGTDAILLNVKNNTAVEQNLKSTYPTVEKTVKNGTEDSNHNSAQIGDKVEFKLVSTVPDMSEYTKGYTFKFTDTLSKGLTLNGVTGTDGNKTFAPTVKIDGVDGDLVKGTDYNATVVENEDGITSLTIEMVNFKSKQQYVGKAITVEYSATLNENAVVGTNGNDNTAKVVYSNDPSTDGTGESQEDKTYTYDFNFGINKVDAENANKKLEGAQFELQDSTGKKIDLVKVSDNTFRPKAKDTEAAAEDTDVKTDVNGVLNFTGLKEGTYKVVETKAPEGYNKLTAPIEVTIHANYDAEGKLTDWGVTKSGETYNKDNTSTTITVENKKGIELPSTGGMGTALFTVFGVLIVALGAGWYVKSNRKASKHAA
ncbi:SpaH/EbpB family LPXTG-anchored major pilin [Bifidobacterium imperatoris]|uniref:Cell surface protein n=1 Tax=Bifidobacterium imperatoris TaxID=2020965 RepID=A0A2N5IU79_9BIFI|nr:SpaH/EbpB family LPXTG-anchored major pilin [Bifidobacterium imperatoris]PLS25523.1 cell surface protein [Bifidobacterium imperatoris]QSY57094.1 SpaH/EbpB family LPXTG-anchored major pilin [Bifidobacterium imperatoris]